MPVTPTLTLRLPQDIREDLERLAAHDRRKLTQYVQKVLIEHVEAAKKKGRK